MKRRRSSAAAAAITVCLLQNSALVTAMTAAPTAPPILRIELENFDQMQFFGTVSVGTPAQEFRVIFDTGSSDVWISDEYCESCSGPRRYKPSQSSTFDPTSNSAFRLEYGSGNASGVVMHETLRLGGSLEIGHVPMGRVNATTKRLQHFHADGIVGLGMASLALITKPGLLTPGDLTLLSTFSIYINPLPGSSPPSQLILGGVDPALAEPMATDKPVQWHYFPLVPFPERKRFGFWAIAMQEMTVLTRIDATDAGGDSTIPVSRQATVIVDSGTSLILLPPRVFNRSIESIRVHLRVVHNVELAPNSAAISGFVCMSCAPSMFPSLSFTFNATSFVLQGPDYVRCDGAYCSPQLDIHLLFGSDSTVEDVIVLGAVFMRAYYTVFDVQEPRVGFACVDGACTGGRLPELRFQGNVFGGGVLSMRSVFWRRVYFSVGAMLFVVACILLWQLLTQPQKQTWRRNSTNDEEVEPEDEPPPRKDSLSPSARCQTSVFGMELLRRLSSTLAIVVVTSTGSESEESAQEPVHTTPHTPVREGANAEKRNGRRRSDNYDEAFQHALDESPEVLRAGTREPTTRFRKSSISQDV